jgi:hypothetical protein
MAERKPIAKKLRFEVFKRDSFTCQYCGGKAPDVLLVCDHVVPVANNGLTDIMNLVTACVACNAGKGATLLSDQSVLAKQRRRLEELNERRTQIEMLLQWRDELLSIEKMKAEKLVDIISAKSKFAPNQHGRDQIHKWVRRFDFEALVAAVDTAFSIYFDSEDDESWETAFGKIPGIVVISKAAEERPYLPKLFYIRGIIRKRLYYYRDSDIMPLLERAARSDLDLDHFTEFCKRLRSWTEFKTAIDDFLERYEDVDE